MDKINCFWGHVWEKWVEYHVDYKRVGKNDKGSGYIIRQKRYCKRCNKMQDEYISKPDDF